MVYEGTQSLMYVKNFVHGTDQWEGFPIKAQCLKITEKSRIQHCEQSYVYILSGQELIKTAKNNQL